MNAFFPSREKWSRMTEYRTGRPPLAAPPSPPSSSPHPYFFPPCSAIKKHANPLSLFVGTTYRQASPRRKARQARATRWFDLGLAQVRCCSLSLVLRRSASHEHPHSRSLLVEITTLLPSLVSSSRGTRTHLSTRSKLQRAQQRSGHSSPARGQASPCCSPPHTSNDTPSPQQRLGAL